MGAVRISFPCIALLMVILASCNNETIPPDVKGEPVFFVQGIFNGKNAMVAAGVDKYYLHPSAITSDNLYGYLPKYYSTFTNGKDSFSVILVGDKLLSPANPDKDILEDVLDRHSLEYAVFMFGGDVDIIYKHNGKSYEPNLGDIPPGSYFNILHSEEYQAPGSTHFMKKVQVSFKIVLENKSNPADKIIIENGRATLLFSYQN